MKIAVVSSDRGFSKSWIDYLKKEGYSFKVINVFSDNIINEIKGCHILLWNWYMDDHKNNLFAKGLNLTLHKIVGRVYPNLDTVLTYENKILQKYLLESINAPLVDTHVFFSKKEAESFISKATYPFVFKLSIGAGAANVKLIKNKKQASQFVRKSFGRGFSVIDRYSILKDSIKSFRPSRKSLHSLSRSIFRYFFKTDFEKFSRRERSYFYAQKFIPENKFDMRIVTIGRRAIGLKRFNRPNDFRASGSNLIDFDKNEIREDCVKIALETSFRLGFQTMAYDFVFDSLNQPKIIEISYAFSNDTYLNCQGYWDHDLNWIDAKIEMHKWIIEDLVSDYSRH